MAQHVEYIILLINYNLISNYNIKICNNYYNKCILK